MANVKDIDFNESFELKIANGDFVLSDSDQNHIMLITKSYLGAFKQYPLIGVGVDYYQASTGQQQVLKRNIKVQLESDSYQVTDVKILANDTYYIDAKRIK